MFSRRVVGVTGALAAIVAVIYSLTGELISGAFYGTETTNMSVNLSKLGQNMVKKVPSMELVPLESIWKDQTVVITFLRRFGCIFCRQGAMEMSTLTPILASHGVKNVAVGLEEFGLEDFLKGEYFNGDLYLDIDKKSYKDIGYYRYSTVGVLMSLVSKVARDRIAQSKRDKLPGDTKGDGLQTGGTMIITKGGAEVLLDFRQENPADHVELSAIFRALNITDPVPSGTGAFAETCPDEKK